jgi:glucose/arabinose dehydrogenase
MKQSALFIGIIVGIIFLPGLAAPVVAQDIDVTWTFGNDGFQDYILADISDPSLSADGPDDPTITLEVGKRYQVSVPSFISHPFQVIAKGETDGQDTVLLAMEPTEGSFQNDPDVNWDYDGFGTAAFTLTAALAEAMNGTADQRPGYRCGVHTSTMRGDFVILGGGGEPVDDPFPETIARGDIRIQLTTVVDELTSPLDLKPLEDGTGRLLVAEQTGQVHLIAEGQLVATPFLDLSNRLVVLSDGGDERGLLSVAVHPDYAADQAAGAGKIYTYTSEPAGGTADFTTPPLPAGTDFDHQSVIAEWQTDPADANKIDPATRREILRIDQPQANHNAGMMAFGPDGYLYIALGDGGGGNDTGAGHGDAGNGQNTDTVHGSILRIDPLDPALTPGSQDGAGANGRYRVPAGNPFVGQEGVDEIYAYGFRNPYRFSFDHNTGRLIVGDVGQREIEEVDLVEAGGNYGWNLKEGAFRFDPATGDIYDDSIGLPPGLVDPVAQYDHDDGVSVIGGYLYRGSAIPDLGGLYVFGDFLGPSSGSGRLFYADLSRGIIRELMIGQNDARLGLFLKGFGADANGELYVLASENAGPSGAGGKVLRIDLPVVPGNIDGRGDVELADAVLALKTAADVRETAAVFLQNDADGDGQIGVADAVFVLEVVGGVRQMGR